MRQRTQILLDELFIRFFDLFVRIALLKAKRFQFVVDQRSNAFVSDRFGFGQLDEFHQTRVKFAVRRI